MIVIDEVIKVSSRMAVVLKRNPEGRPMLEFVSASNEPDEKFKLNYYERTELVNFYKRNGISLDHNPLERVEEMFQRPFQDKKWPVLTATDVMKRNLEIGK